MPPGSLPEQGNDLEMGSFYCLLFSYNSCGKEKLLKPRSITKNKSRETVMTCISPHKFRKMLRQGTLKSLEKSTMCQIEMKPLCHDFFQLSSVQPIDHILAQIQSVEQKLK